MHWQRGVMVATVLAVATGVAVASQGQATASGAWILQPSAGASSTSAFAVIENPTMYDVYVVGVTSEVAGSAEIADGPVDAAKTVKDLTVPAYGQTELAPGGIHIRLKDLKRPLEPGESVELVLTLDSGATIKVSAPVKKG